MVKGYKVFDADWQCKGKQYTCPGIFEEDVDPCVCESGMHFCKEAVDCFEYYLFRPYNKVAEVIAYGDVAEEGDKCCTNKLEIVREIPWTELLEIINTGIGCTGRCNSGSYNSGSCNSGWCNTGFCNSGVNNSGDYNSGDNNSGNFNSGYRNSGDCNSGNHNTGDYNSGNYNINDIYHKVRILRKELSHAPRDYIILLDFGGRTAYRDKQQEESRRENKNA